MTTAIVLNWNTLDVSKDSVRRLSKEVPVIVVDNGSTDGTFEYFRDHPKANVEFVPMGENVGNAVARNVAIKKVKTDYFFLLDGDILYVPNSIKILEGILKTYKDAGCVGVHDPNRVEMTGMNGTRNILEADTRVDYPTGVYKGFPMAWTQYGLFRTKNILFPDQYPFDRAGYGYEDSWYYQLMKEAGLESYYIETPLYFHDAHSSKRELAKDKTDLKEDERKQAFNDRFGEVDWLDRKFEVTKVL